MVRGGSTNRGRGRPVSVAVVDDHQIIPDLFEAAFEAMVGRFRFVGSAGSLHDLPTLLNGPPADVVLVDFALPDGRGSDAIREIGRAWPRARILLFSAYSEIEVVEEAIAAGADGIVAKGLSIEKLLDIIERAHRGEVLLDPRFLRELAGRPEAGGRRLAAIRALSPRERAALEALLSRGTTEAAAELLGIAPATVRVHIHRAAQKLGSGSRLETISIALRAGVIRPPAHLPPRA